MADAPDLDAVTVQAVSTASRSPVPLRLCYAAIFAALGAYLPYFPRWLEARGIDGLAMSAISALMPAMGIVGPPLFGLAADQLGLRGRLLRVACFGAALPFATLAFTTAFGGPPGFGALFALVAVASFFRSPIVMLTDVLALERVRSGGGTYGGHRFYGSLGFLVLAIVVGRFVDPSAPAELPAVVAACLVVSLGAALLLPSRAPKTATATAPRREGAVALLRTPGFRRFLAIAFLSQAGHASYDLCATLHVRDLGVSSGFAGVWWALGVASEIVLMRFGAPLFPRFGSRRLLAAGLAGASVRWAGLAFAKSPVALIALQLLHASSFGLVWLAALAHLEERVEPANVSTAQGLFSAAIGLGSVVGMLVWGPLYSARGGATVFAAAAFVSALAAGLAAAFARARLAPVRPALVS